MHACMYVVWCLHACQVCGVCLHSTSSHAHTPRQYHTSVSVYVSVVCSHLCVYLFACVQIGSDTYTLQEVVTRPDLVARMTPDEKAAYTELYREAYEELHT